MENLQTQGISLPRLGLGTFRMQGEACRAAVESALALGYRHIDTAEMYGNEEAIGAAIAPRRRRAQRTARHHKGLEREPRAGCDPPGVRCQPEEAAARSCRSLSGALAVAKNMKLPAMFETLIEAEGGRPHQSHRRRQFQHRAAQDRGRGNQGADRLQPGRISRDARPDAAAEISRGANRSRWWPIARWRRAGRLPTKR